jgi:Fe-S cluster assembly protein SufD
MALPKLKADATAARLSSLTMPVGEAGWAHSARLAARDRLAAMGLPGPRDEYWRFTDPASLNTPEAPIAALFDPQETRPFEAIPRLRIVFVDGQFAPDLSDDLSLAGIEVMPLAQALSRDLHWARDLYGQLEARSQTPVQRPFAALNTAFATDGMVIRVTRTPDRPVNLTYLHRAEQSDAILHHLVKLDPGVSLTLLENGPAAARFNKAIEVDLGDGATLHHVRTQGRDHERRAVTGVFARLATQASLKSFTMTVNGRLTRNECVVWLDGEGGSAHLAGASLGDGDDFHHDDTVFVTHAAPHCESRQVFKKVLRNGAVGVFQGKILVQPGAQKTDGYQISQSLLLDEDSQFLAKPELEIYADDVVCSHGSTSGAIDAIALYYLRSRGIPLAEAKDLMVLAFVAEALDEIADPRLVEDLRGRLEGWLSRHRH